MKLAQRSFAVSLLLWFALQLNLVGEGFIGKADIKIYQKEEPGK